MQFKAKFLMNRDIQKNGLPGLIVTIPPPKLNRDFITVINIVEKIHVAS